MKKRNLMVALAYTITSLSMGASYSASAISAEKTPMEIVSKRTEYDKYFDNGDGTITAIMNTAPLHYYEDGKWVEIDNTLEINADGDYVNKSNSMNVTIASTASPKSAESTDDEENMVQIEYNGYSISWDLINTQSNSNEASSKAKLVSVDDERKAKISLSNEKLSGKASECFDKLKSEVVYDSFMEDVDVSLALESSSVKETIILNDKESMPDSFTYFLDTDGLIAKLNEDNSIGLTNKSGKNIFTIPTMYMFDSAEDISEYNYDIETSLEAVDNGYLLTITPDKEWIASDERVYPIMIDPTVTTNIAASSLFVKQSTPNSIYDDGYLRIGGYADAGNLQEAIVYSPSLNSTDMMVIKDAKLHMTFDLNLFSGPAQPIEVYTINSVFYNPCWNTCGGDNVPITYITELNVPDSYSEVEFDITNAVQADVNYDRTNGSVGSFCYAYKLKAKNDASKLYLAISERSYYPGPYFEITYATNTAYTMEYSEEKYNNVNVSNGVIYNFQRRMNCYAYALQIYDRGSDNSTVHRLTPGEIGLRSNGSNYTITNLISGYNNCNSISAFMDFTERQMFYDSAKMHTNLTRINLEDDETFVLPGSYSGRIIAMTAGSKTNYSPSGIGVNTSQRDFHFYVRHGNGTCPTHRNGVCSMWSHKLSEGTVSNKVNGYILCDCNIATKGKSLSVNTSAYSVYNYSQPLRFYSLEQDTNVYDSWYYYTDDNTPLTIHN